MLLSKDVSEEVCDGLNGILFKCTITAKTELATWVCSICQLEEISEMLVCPIQKTYKCIFLAENCGLRSNR